MINAKWGKAVKYTDVNMMRSGYRSLLYDAAVLLAAIRQLEQDSTGDDEFNIGTNRNQLATESALVKARSLYDFFTAKPSGDDISCLHFDFPRKMLNQKQETFRTAIHKFSMHLTWERVKRTSASLPRQRTIVKRGREILPWVTEFIAHCRANALKPNGYGPRYLRYIRGNTT